MDSNARNSGSAHVEPRGGEKTIDPSENVKALSEASQQRQDDLRIETNRRQDEGLVHLRDIVDLYAVHQKEIRELEARRLDAIRQVDVTAVKTEADRALAAISVLATTTATNAENLRNALTNTAATIAKQTSDTVSQITERIAALEKSSYEGAGKQSRTDPQFEKMVDRMETMLTQSANTSGKGQGAAQLWGLIVGGVAFLIMVAVFLMNLYK